MILSDTVFYYIRGAEALRRVWEIGEVRKLCLLAGWSFQAGEELIEAGVSPAEACQLFLRALERPIA